MHQTNSAAQMDSVFQHTTDVIAFQIAMTEVMKLAAVSFEKEKNELSFVDVCFTYFLSLSVVIHQRVMLY